MNSQHLIIKKVCTEISCVFINLELLCRQKLSKTMKGVGRSEGKVHLADWTCHHWIIPCSTLPPNSNIIAGSCDMWNKNSALISTFQGLKCPDVVWNLKYSLKLLTFQLEISFPPSNFQIGERFDCVLSLSVHTWFISSRFWRVASLRRRCH